MSRFKVCTFVFCFLLLLARPARPQTGTVEGTLADPSGAMVPGAAVKLANIDTSATFETVTNGSGLFRFPVVPVGIYDLTAKHTGFAMLTGKFATASPRP